MNQKEIRTKNSKGLSTSCIKTIALVCMFIDHLAAGIVMRLMYLPNHPIFQKISTWMVEPGSAESNLMLSGFSQQMWIVNLYQWMRNIGRISFPIYCFFIVEGFYKTRDRKRYVRRLAACALISEIPFDLAIYGKVFYLWHQNIFVTLLVGLFAIWALDSVVNLKEMGKGTKILTVLCIGAGFVLVAELLFADYAGFGVLCIIVMYLVRKLIEKRIKFWGPIVYVAGVAVLCILNPGEVWALLALPLMCFYKGKKGWNAKWFFYLFYPVHLLIIAILALCLGVQSWSVI